MTPLERSATGASLALAVSNPQYIERVAVIAEQLARAPDQPKVLALTRAGVAALQAERAVFISFVRDHRTVSACRFVLDCDPEWCRAYLAGECFIHDPWLAYAALHSEPVVASALPGSGPQGDQVSMLAARFGFVSTLLVPVHSGGGHSRVSVLCLGSSVTGFFEGEGQDRCRIAARALAAELHDWWLRRVRHELVVRARLSTADVDLLRHQAQGHSSKRIAAELQVSHNSINSRFQRLNTKLGVPNRRMAVRLAEECGLL